MSLVQASKTLFLSIAMVLSGAAALQAQGRGPSTAEERAKVVQLALASEKDLMGGTTEEERAWFLKLIADVPDITLQVGQTAVWCSKSVKEDQGSLALFQFMLSAVAFQIESPLKAKDAEAVDLAGLEGVLRSYENLIRKSPRTRTGNMDEALALRGKGELLGFVKKLRAQKS